MRNEFAYLFLVDLTRIPFKHTYQSYTSEEPGYGSAMLQAYITAFSTPTDGTLSEDLIKKINKAAMQWSTPNRNGAYRNSYNNYKIAPFVLINDKNELASNPTFSVTDQGMKEYLSYWMKEESFLCLVFESQAPNLPHYMIDSAPNGFTVKSKISGSEKPPITTLKDLNQVLLLVNKLLSSRDYKCQVNPLVMVPEHEIQAAVTKKSQQLIRDYNKEIKSAASEDKKITVIVTFVQRMAQLHPWFDGNIRTGYILLNKLLRDNGLSLTLLMNPNRFDCCSVAELVAQVKVGQTHFKQVKDHKSGSLILRAPNEESEFLQSITCPEETINDVKDSLLNSFFDEVVNGISPKTNNVANNRFGFLAEPESTTEHIQLLEKLSLITNISDKKYESFMVAIKNKTYSLALRKACTCDNPVIISTLIRFAESLGVNPNEQSSNGKNAYDWLKENHSLTLVDKELIQEQFLAINLSKLNINNSKS